MIIIDTSAWIHILSGRGNPWAEWFQANMDDEGIGLTDLTLCEILQGLRTDQHAKETELYLRGFDIHATGGIDSAVAAAANYRHLRRQGITVRNSVDCLIATHCVRHDYALLHHDRDFDPFEQHLGLRVIHP